MNVDEFRITVCMKKRRYFSVSSINNSLEIGTKDKPPSVELKRGLKTLLLSRAVEYCSSLPLSF